MLLKRSKEDIKKRGWHDDQSWHSNCKRIYFLQSKCLERSFLQQIKKKLTNLDNFPPLNYPKRLNPPLFAPPNRISEKNFPHWHVSFRFLAPLPLFVLAVGGGGGERKLWNCRNICWIKIKMKMNILVFVKTWNNNKTTIIMKNTTKSQSNMYI